STESISASIFARMEPIYFVSRVLQGAELNYSALEKLILALVHVLRRLQGYFQAYTVAILTNSPIKQALMKLEKSGRVAKWGIKLAEHDIVKEIGRQTDTKLEETKQSCEWKLYTDEASSSDGSGAGLMLIDPEDSKLLVNQIKGIYAAKQPAIREYLQRTKETLRRFRSYTIERIRRNQNKKADTLRKLASMTFEHLTKEVLVEVLARRSIEENEFLQVKTKEKESWMTPIHEYLLSGLLPKDSKESRKIRIKAPQYKLVRGSLYKKSFYTPWLRCIASPKTDDVIKEIHEGSRSFNTKPRSMVVRITKQGYYWPSMHKDNCKNNSRLWEMQRAICGKSKNRGNNS
ncbi:reverse transcriptase domain-containing protein, partial [Tanacetum coccineum]